MFLGKFFLKTSVAASKGPPLLDFHAFYCKTNRKPSFCMLLGAANLTTGVLPRGLCQELWLRVLELDVGTPLERLWRPRKLRSHRAAL